MVCGKVVGDKVVGDKEGSDQVVCVWQSCVWRMVCDKDGCDKVVWNIVCDKVVCERWCVTKLWVTKLWVTKLWVTKRGLTKLRVTKLWDYVWLCVKESVWQSCVWKMVCDKVVCVWNIWIDVKLLPVVVVRHFPFCLLFMLMFYFNYCSFISMLYFKQGVAADHLGPLPTKTPIWSGDTDWGANLRTCTNFQFRQWQPAKPEPASRSVEGFLVLLHCCRNLRFSFDNWREASASTLLLLVLTMAMVPFRYFLRSCHRPIPVRYNWSVFARKMHSTSEFAMIVLSKCVKDGVWQRVVWQSCV